MCGNCIYSSRPQLNYGSVPRAYCSRTNKCKLFIACQNIKSQIVRKILHGVVLTSWTKLQKFSMLKVKQRRQSLFPNLTKTDNLFKDYSYRLFFHSLILLKLIWKQVCKSLCSSTVWNVRIWKKLGSSQEKYSG